MLNLRKILCLCFILFLCFSSVCMATSTSNTTQEGNQSSSPQLSIVNTDLYLADTNVVIDNAVDGNVFVYGQNVSIKGEIIGDLFVLANTLTIENSAIIDGNVFAYATDFTVKGKTVDIYGLAQNFKLDEKGNIYRDLKLYTNNCYIGGNIVKDAYISAANLNFKEDGQDLIKGNLHYTSNNQASIPENAVKGEVKFTEVKNEQLSASEIVKMYVLSFINVFAYSAVVIALIINLIPKAADKLTYCLSKRSFATATVGILGVVLVPIISVIVLAAGLFLYLGIALLAIYVLMLSITISILGIAVGNYLANKLKSKTKMKTILLCYATVAVIWLLQLIPYVGSWISIFTIVFGYGLILFALFSKKKVENVEATETTK